MSKKNKSFGRINIVFLTSSSDMGGAEKLVFDLVKRLDRSRFEPWVISLFGSGALTERCREIDVKAHNLSLSSPLKFKQFLNLKYLLKDVSPDIIQTCGLRADTAGRLLKKTCGAKMFISTIHNIDPWRKWYHVLLDRATASRTDLFIAVSEAVRRTRLEREKFPPDKIITIHNGIDVEYFELLPEKKNALEFFGLSADEPHPVVGVLANLRKQKGHFEIIEALPSICEKLPEIKIIFAGKDFSEGEVQRRAREKGVQDRIVFAGFVKDSRQLLSASDILLLPSHWEGFPVSVLEAMAAGVPVIATPVGGVPEMIKNNETGILIPPGSPRAIEDAVVSLVEDPQKAEGLSKRAREVVRKRFDINTMVEKYRDVYIELLAKLNN